MVKCFTYNEKVNSSSLLLPNGVKKRNLLKKIKTFTINFGSQHLAAHSVLRLILELNDEIVNQLGLHIILLHRGTEKIQTYAFEHLAIY